jgi:DNA-binding Lrp family transcriptional regulator
VALSEADDRLVAVLERGLPVTPHPYRELASRAGMSEAEVLQRIEALLAQGTIKRLGVVVRHRALGWRANAMVVFDVPDAKVDATGEWLGHQDSVTLCYRRPRRPPHWPYNLFCMIHGRARDEVRERIRSLREDERLTGVAYAVLFSSRCFKQCGARYRGNGQTKEAGHAPR